MSDEASKSMQKYFLNLKKRSLKAHKIATKARQKGFDPEEFVEIKLAENLAERVVGLISAIAPQIVNSGVMERILELENEYAPLDWRVSLIIAHEIGMQNFCKFEDEHEAMEVGIRTGFAYVTLGVVSAPLEGFTSLELKDRNDGKGKYFCLNYSGPIRAAGGTAASVSVLIADYVRKKMGYDRYDPTKKEIKRCAAELEDYHNYITNLQYFPSKEESEFLLENMPVEISGDPSEKYEISSALLKDLPRVPTNRLRSGYCLVHSSCVPLKAPKMWKRLQKWGKDLDMEQWNFMKDFLDLQSKMKSKGKKKKKEEKGVKPNYTYIKDLVGGRPVLGHPLREGGLRLRYGRGRNTGFSSQAVHPATMITTNEFLAIGTQLKTERPGKAAAYNSCDTIEGPIVKLANDDVVKLDSIKKANEYKKLVKEVIYLGDVLINYGDFIENAAKLVPSGYCQEIWIQHLKQVEDNPKKVSEKTNIKQDVIIELFKNFLTKKITYNQAKKLSEVFNIPLHPDYIFYYKSMSIQDLKKVRKSLNSLKHVNSRLSTLKDMEVKRIIELLGIPHKVKKGTIIMKRQNAQVLLDTLQVEKETYTYKEDVLKTIQENAPYNIEDKAGTFVGTRMGRPEKAKMRKLTGSPHTLFPVGEEGGRLRSFQSAMDKGKITALMEMFRCESCEKDTPFRRCETCDEKTKPLKFNRKGEPDKEGENNYRKGDMKITQTLRALKNKHKIRLIPDLVKGVRGTSNRQKITEYLPKGILRAKHQITVNKDGTTRYDCSELAITHFKPKEIGVSIEKLKELGYEKDTKGKPLEDKNQVLELKVQDILLPCCPDAVNEPADEILMKTARFVDEELVKIYGMKPYYNVKKREDLVGKLAIGLAPHTSAGILTRIIGFTKTQGFYAHPYVHAAMRRDCDGDEACVTLLMDSFLNFSKKYLPSSRGSTMDAPLVLTSKIVPTEVDDMIFNLDVVNNYPLEFYEATKALKMPWEVDIEVIKNRIGTPNQYENISYTHDTSNINQGVIVSAYKTLPSMGEKVESQMDIAVKIRAVDQRDVAKLIIDKHFIRDTKGNLKKFSLQQFRCVNCNTKYRRPPLSGKCKECYGKIIFTISEGSIVKYMDYSLMLANKYDIDTYTKQVLDLTQVRIEGVFGREKEKQTGLSTFM